jgi:hypothetical protein
MNTTASTFFSLMAEFGTAQMLLESMCEQLTPMLRGESEATVPVSETNDYSYLLAV